MEMSCAVHIAAVSSQLHQPLDEFQNLMPMLKKGNKQKRFILNEGIRYHIVAKILIASDRRFPRGLMLRYAMVEEPYPRNSIAVVTSGGVALPWNDQLLKKSLPRRNVWVPRSQDCRWIDGIRKLKVVGIFHLHYMSLNNETTLKVRRYFQGLQKRP